MIEQLQEKLNQYNKAKPRVESTREALTGLDFPNPRYNLSSISDLLEFEEKAKKNIEIVKVIDNRTLPFLDSRIENLKQEITEHKSQEYKAKLAQGILDLEEAVKEGLLSSEVLQRARELAGFTEPVTNVENLMTQDIESIKIPGQIISFLALVEEKPQETEKPIKIDQSEQGIEILSAREAFLNKLPSLQRKIVEVLLTGSKEKPLTREVLTQRVYGQEIEQGKYTLFEAKHIIGTVLRQDIEKKLPGLNLNLETVKVKPSVSKRIVNGHYLTEIPTEISKDVVAVEKTEIVKESKEKKPSHANILKSLKILPGTLESKAVLAIIQGKNVGEIGETIFKRELESGRYSLAHAKKRVYSLVNAINKKAEKQQFPWELKMQDDSSLYCIIPTID